MARPHHVLFKVCCAPCERKRCHLCFRRSGSSGGALVDLSRMKGARAALTSCRAVISAASTSAPTTEAIKVSETTAALNLKSLPT